METDVEVDIDVEIEEDENDEFDENEINVDVDIEIEPELNQDFDDIIKQVRKISKFFRQSPVRNEEHLQPLVRRNFGKELNLYLDVVTRWNSLSKMLKRFYKLRTEVKMACVAAGLNFTLSDQDLEKINELSYALTTLEFAIKMLSKTDADLLYAEQMSQFVILKLDEQNSQISQVLKEAFEERVLSRRQTKVIHLMEYLKNPRYLEKQQDFFKKRIVKSDVAKLAVSLTRRLFPAAEGTQVEDQAPE